jgi:Holliday junction resolvase RusA-like endonuclease
MWVLDIPPGDLINANERLHWAVRARRTRDLKADAFRVARAARVPRMDRIRVVGVVHPPDRRRRDPHNLYPTLKAYIDGIVMAGVLVDDDASHLVEVSMVIGSPAKPLRLSVEIYPIDGANARV